jgi:hypothetical protein
MRFFRWEAEHPVRLDMSEVIWERQVSMVSLPQVYQWEERALSLRRALPRVVRQCPESISKLNQNKAWPVSNGPLHPINCAYIYVMLQA